jgi:glycosyltransferase involved in cell wall biosynthesis
MFHPAGNPQPRAPFRILYAGSLTIQKGPQYLLEAVKRMRADVRLIMAGPVDPAFKAILSRYEGVFEYRGILSKVELQRLYSDCSVFVLPSLSDSFSLATLEAMACGIPVIVSENTGVADLIQNGKEGFVVPIRDARCLAQRLEQLYLDRDLVETMGKSARQTALETTWDRYGNRAVDLYRNRLSSIIGGTRSPEAVRTP